MPEIAVSHVVWFQSLIFWSLTCNSQRSFEFNLVKFSPLSKPSCLQTDSRVWGTSWRSGITQIQWCRLPPWLPLGCPSSCPYVQRARGSCRHKSPRRECYVCYIEKRWMESYLLTVFNRFASAVGIFLVWRSFETPWKGRGKQEDFRTKKISSTGRSRRISWALDAFPHRNFCISTFLSMHSLHGRRSSGWRWKWVFFVSSATFSWCEPSIMRVETWRTSSMVD